MTVVVMRTDARCAAWRCGEGAAGQERHAGDVRHVEDDEARAPALAARSAVHQSAEIVAERPDLLVDVAARIVAAGAAAERAGDDVGLVGAREDGDERRTPSAQTGLPESMKLPRTMRPVCVPRSWKRAADDAGRNARGW